MTKNDVGNFKKYSTEQEYEMNNKRISEEELDDEVEDFGSSQDVMDEYVNREVGEINWQNEWEEYTNKYARKVSKDKAEAIKWCENAAAKGDAAAQFQIGYCYEIGEGVSKDNRAAFTWYMMAAAQEYAPAMNRVGVCYRNGVGVRHNDREGIFWYTKAAEQGYVLGQYNLGWCYEFGIGVDKIDKVKAVEWYRKAKLQGHPISKDRIKVIIWQILFILRCKAEKINIDTLKRAKEILCNSFKSMMLEDVIADQVVFDMLGKWLKEIVRILQLDVKDSEYFNTFPDDEVLNKILIDFVHFNKVECRIICDLIGLSFFEFFNAVRTLEK